MQNITNLIPEIPIIIEKPKTNYLGITLISLAFVLFLAGAYFLGKQSSVVPEVVAVPTTAPVTALPTTTAPTVTADPTVNWKTYNNSLLGYSFRYPQNWLLTDLSAGEQIEVYYQPDKTKSVGEILIEKINAMSYNREVNSGQLTLEMFIGGIKIKCKTADESKTWCYPSQGDKYLSILITKDTKANDWVYNNTLDQILSTFKFTETKAENLFILNNSNFYLNFPSDSIINKNNVTIGNSTFNINTFIGPGLCPMDETEAMVESCTYTDQPGSKWGIYRVWTKNSKSFAINPQSIRLNNKYFDGMIVTKSKPNEFFTQAELLQWKDILNKISISEQ